MRKYRIYRAIFQCVRHRSSEVRLFWSDFAQNFRKNQIKAAFCQSAIVIFEINLYAKPSRRMTKAIEARVYGKVQGVWFRKHTQEQAHRLGLTGIVRNEPDGSVYVEAEGPEDKMRMFEEWLHRGSPLSRVERVDIRRVEPKGYQSFEIIR